jgi:hypothetical protein
VDALLQQQQQCLLFDDAGNAVHDRRLVLGNMATLYSPEAAQEAQRAEAAARAMSSKDQAQAFSES